MSDYTDAVAAARQKQDEEQRRERGEETPVRNSLKKELKYLRPDEKRGKR